MQYGICYLNDGYTQLFYKREDWEHELESITEESGFDVWFEGNIAVVDTCDDEYEY